MFHARSRDDVTRADSKHVLRHPGPFQKVWPWNKFAVVAGGVWLSKAHARGVTSTAALYLQLITAFNFYRILKWSPYAGYPQHGPNLHDLPAYPILFHVSVLFSCF